MTSQKPFSPLFILMHGPPGAGKSAFASRFSQQNKLAHISSDRVRYELFDDPRYTSAENRTVFRLCSYMAEIIFSQSQPIVFDMNLPSHTMRKEMKKLANSNGYNFLILWVQTEKEEAMRRSTHRDRRRPDDKYSPSLSGQLFEAIAAKSGRPDPDKEALMVISGQQPFSQQQAQVSYKLNKLGFIPAPDKALQARLPRVDYARRQSGPRQYGRS